MRAAALARDLKTKGYGGSTGTIILHAYADDEAGNRYISRSDTYFDLNSLRIFVFP